MVVGAPALTLPSPTTSSSPIAASPTTPSNTHVGDVVGAVIATLVVAGCIAGVAWWLWRRKARRASRSSVVVEEIIPVPTLPSPPPPTYPPPSFPRSSCTCTSSLPFRSVLASYLSHPPSCPSAASSVTARDARAEPPRYKEDWDEEEKVEGWKRLDEREGSVDSPRRGV